jgi:diguanylate cyclase (GGDEF)-like protein/PAS domain S-box-containing protein
MPDVLTIYLPYLLGFSAFAYTCLAVFVAQTSDQNSKNVISFFVLLIGVMVAGSAFSYGTVEANTYGLGRVLSFFAGGFLPLTFYVIYRQFTVGPPSTLFLTVLSIIPVATTVLAITNPMHGMLWNIRMLPTGLQVSDLTEHWWFMRVHAPFAYGLFGYSALALILRLPTIAPAHRKTIVLLVACAVMPYTIALSNTFLGIGNQAFPFTSTTLTVLFPLYVYATVTMKVYDFNPLEYKTLFNHVRDPIIVLDNDQVIVCANKAAEELLNAPEYELVGRALWQDFPEAQQILQKAQALDLTQTLRLNQKAIYEVSVAPLTGQRGQQLGMVVVCRDVTERRKAQTKLAESEHLVRTLIETSSNGILRFSKDKSEQRHGFRCVFSNRAAESFLADGRGTLVGMPMRKLDAIEPDKLITHFENPETADSGISFETCKQMGGKDVWLRIVGEPVGEDFSVTVIDVTQRKRNEDKMLADALRDPLTGVLNRRGFEQKGQSCTRDQETGAVLYLDLNGFKSVNDRFGHQAGDALLKAFGHRLEFCLRNEDVLGRLGGDEFVIILPGVSVDDAKHVAERLVQTASDAYIIQGKEIICTASVGIALMPKHGQDLWHLVSVADQAMYNAKAIGEEQAANDRAAYVEAAIAS